MLLIILVFILIFIIFIFISLIIKQINLRNKLKSDLIFLNDNGHLNYNKINNNKINFFFKKNTNNNFKKSINNKEKKIINQDNFNQDKITYKKYFSISLTDYGLNSYNYNYIIKNIEYNNIIINNDSWEIINNWNFENEIINNINYSFKKN